MSAPIFISYSSKDRPIAETICQALEARGLSCWIACRDVRAGENFQESIVRALRGARVMLLVFSGNANNSEEIKKELVLAGRHHVTVVPARVEDVLPSDAFTYELATRQWIDLFSDWEREMEQLVAQLEHILQSADPNSAPAVAIPVPKSVPPRRQSSNKGLIAGLALLALLLVIGGAVLYLKPWAPAPVSTPAAPIMAQAPPAPTPPAPTAPPAVQAQSAQAQSAPAAPAATRPARHAAPAQPAATAPAAAPVAPAPQQQAAAPAPQPPASAPPAPQNSDESAWAAAVSAGTRASFADYLKTYSTGVHVQEAQLQMANLILNAPATGTEFDGAWQTIWTCSNLGQYPGYSYQFVGQVKDGTYHGSRGVKGEPSSLVLDGKIESDGAAAFFGEVVVGSSMTGLGVARGTPSDFHAMAQFQRSSATGRRLEGRACSLSFQKQ